MPEWATIYEDSYETGFYDQNGAGELTVPIGHVVEWDTDAGPRPECDDKNAGAGQSEVYDGQHAASVFTVYATHDAWLVAGPIAVVPGLPTRASVYSMIVCHGVGGDDSKPGDQGTVLGVGESGERAAAVYGDWWSVRDTLASERVWTRLETPTIAPAGDKVWLFLRSKANWAAAINAAHFDLETVEQLIDDITPPPPPVGGSLQEHIDEVQAALDRLQGYVNSNARSCLLV